MENKEVLENEKYSRLSVALETLTAEKIEELIETEYFKNLLNDIRKESN